MGQRTEYGYDPVTRVFSGERTNNYQDYEPEVFPLGFCTVVKPDPGTGQVSVWNKDKEMWEYFPDNSGQWFSTYDKTPIQLKPSDYLYDTSKLTRLVPPEMTPYCSWSTTEWIVDTATKIKDINNANVKNQLSVIDFYSARSIRSILVAGTSPEPKDLEKLKEYETQVISLRSQLK